LHLGREKLLRLLFRQLFQLFEDGDYIGMSR
jgi:hypothetical protein